MTHCHFIGDKVSLVSSGVCNLVFFFLARLNQIHQSYTNALVWISITYICAKSQFKYNFYCLFLRLLKLWLNLLSCCPTLPPLLLPQLVKEIHQVNLTTPRMRNFFLLILLDHTFKMVKIKFTMPCCLTVN